MQAIGIIVADIFPVHSARSHRHTAKRPEFFKTIGRDLVFIRRHHVGNRRAAAFQTDKDKTAPDFHVDGDKARFVLVQSGVGRAVRNTRQAAIKIIGPGMIRAHKFLGASARSIDQAAAPVAADIGKGTQHLIRTAHDDDAFANIIEAMPVATVCDIADMANDLP